MAKKAAKFTQMGKAPALHEDMETVQVVTSFPGPEDKDGNGEGEVSPIASPGLLLPVVGRVFVLARRQPPPVFSGAVTGLVTPVACFISRRVSGFGARLFCGSVAWCGRFLFPGKRRDW